MLFCIVLSVRLFLMSDAGEWHASTLVCEGMSLRLNTPPDGLLRAAAGFRPAVLVTVIEQAVRLDRLIRSGPCRCIRCGVHDIIARTTG